MNTIALMIVACAMGGKPCETHKVDFLESEVTLHQCMIGGWAQAARWQEAHPHRYVRKIWCETPRQEANL